MVSKKKQLFTRFIAMVLSVIILISPVYADVLIDYNGSTNTGGSQGGGTSELPQIFTVCGSSHFAISVSEI